MYNGGCNPVCSLFSEALDKKEGRACIGARFLFPCKDNTNKCSYVTCVIKTFDQPVDLSKFDLMKGWIFSSSSEILPVSFRLFDLKGAIRYYSYKSKPEDWTEFSLPLDRGWTNRPFKMEEIKRVEMVIYSSDKLAYGKERYVLLDGFRFEKTQLSFGEIRPLKQETGACIEMPKLVFADMVAKPPRLDVKTDEACWKDKRENNFLPADASKSLKKQSSLALCYDARNLYIMMEFLEPDVSRIKKEMKERDGDIWKDDCAEIFLMPRASEYFHFIVTAANVQFDEKASRVAGGFNRDKAWNAEWKSAVKIEDGKWIVEMAIPFKELGVPPPAEGEVWKGNFCREEKELGENSSYFQTDGWFPETDCFGDIVIGNFSPILREELAGLEKKINDIQEDIAKYNDPELIARLGRAQEGVGAAKAGLPGKITDEKEYRKIKAEIIGNGGDIKDVIFDYYASKDGYLVWQKSPIASLARGKIPINVKEDLKEITLVMGRNEIEMCSLVIANFKERALCGRVVASRFKDGKGNLVMPDFISLKGTAFIELKSNRLIDDPLPALNEVNEIVALPRENKEVILFVDSWKLQPGTYSGIIDIRPYEGTNSFPVKTVKLNISVMPVDLGKDHLTLQVFEMANYIWTPEKLRDYNLRIDEFKIADEAWPEYVKDMAAHRVNVFRPVRDWVPYPIVDETTKKITTPLDPERLPFFDCLLSLYKKHGKDNQIVNVGVGAVNAYLESKGLIRSSSEWKNALAAYFTALISHMKEQGFSEDSFTLYVYDEITGEDCDRFCEVAGIIKSIAPRVKIFLTPRSVRWNAAIAEDIRKTAPCVDVWCPYIKLVAGTGFAGEFDILKGTAKPVWSYANHGYSDQKGSPLNIEKYGWLAWDKNIQGIGSWSYNCWVSDGWDDFDNFSADPKANKRSAEAYVYWGPKGPGHLAALGGAAGGHGGS